MKTTNRRQFLWLMGGTAGVGLAGWAAWCQRGQAGLGGQPSGTATFATGSASLAGVMRRDTALGSQVEITALHRDRQTANRAVDAAFDQLERVEQLLSIYRPDSQLSQLNQHGFLAAADPYLLEVLRVAEQISRKSNGAFDITVQPLWSLFSEAAKRHSLPEPGAVHAARQCVDWRRVHVQGNRVRLAGRGTQITLNGIAQGFAADCAMQAVRSCGVEHALINTGEIGALGHRQDGQSWRIGIQHPRHEDAYAALARLSGRCMATSGDYATRFADGYQFHHLFDPRTGRSADQLASVTVVAPSAMLADALSTACFILGPDRGMQLIQPSAEVDGLFILRDGSSLVTDGFPTAWEPTS